MLTDRRFHVPHLILNSQFDRVLHLLPEFNHETFLKQ